jgi:AcrR family transcriptional regulator
MTKNSKTAEAVPLAESRGGNRRDVILEAFHECIIEKGYSKTTLRDVARSAGMTASHLLYYFSGKDAILEHYFDVVAQRIIKRIDSFRNDDPKRQADQLADLFFAGKGITNSETGFMLECFGVAVHDRQLHDEKAALDQFCKNYLEDFFLKASRNQTDARDNAEITYALLIGLRTAAYFDDRLELEQARRLFHAGLMDRAGLTNKSSFGKEAK